jgi:hypothetical protein
VRELKSAIASSTSFLGASKILRISRSTIVKAVCKHKINISHFIPCAARPKPIKDIFCIGKKRDSAVRRALIQRELMSYKCVRCGQGGIWKGKRLVLELDHINGNPCDNRIKNLRFLCPNCHSQTLSQNGNNHAREKGSVRRRK